MSKLTRLLVLFVIALVADFLNGAALAQEAAPTVARAVRHSELLQVVVSSPGITYQVGDPIFISIQLKNTSSQVPVRFWAVEIRFSSRLQP